MRKILVSLLTSIALLVSFFALPVSAGSQGSCAMQDTTKVILYENKIGDTSDGDDRLWLCSSTLDFRNLPHTLPGMCHYTFVKTYDDWDNCVSSMTVFLPSGDSTWRACYYTGYNAGGSVGYISGSSSYNGVRFDVGSTFNDAISGLIFLHTTACQ